MDYYKLKTPLKLEDAKAQSYVMEKGKPPELLPAGYDHLHYAIDHGWNQLEEPNYDVWYAKNRYTKTTIFKGEFTVLGNDKKERDRLAIYLGVNPNDLKPA